MRILLHIRSQRYDNFFYNIVFRSPFLSNISEEDATRAQKDLIEKTFAPCRASFFNKRSPYLWE